MESAKQSENTVDCSDDADRSIAVDAKLVGSETVSVCAKQQTEANSSQTVQATSNTDSGTADSGDVTVKAPNVEVHKEAEANESVSDSDPENESAARYANFSNSTSAKRVFVRNVSEKMTHEHLTEAFRQFGSVRKVIIPRDSTSWKNSRIAHVEFYEAASAQRCVEAKRVNVKKSTVRVELAYSHWRPSWKAVKQRESQMWCGVASKTNESEAENARNGEETESEDTDYFSLLPDLCLERIFFYMSANERIVNERVCVRWRSILRSLWCRLRVFSFDTFRLPFACTITVDAYRSIIKRLRSARPLTTVDCSSKLLHNFSGEHLDALLACEFDNLVELNLSFASLGWKQLEALVRTYPTAFERLERLSISHCDRLGEKGMWYVARYCRNLRSLNAEALSGLHGNTCFHLLTKRLERLVLSHCAALTENGLNALTRSLHSNVSSDWEGEKETLTRQFSDALVDNSGIQLTIEMDHCPTVTDAAFRSLMSVAGPRIKVLRFAGSCLLQSATFCSLANCAALTDLSLRENTLLHDEALQLVCNSCPLLASLDVSACGNPLTDAGFSCISQCQQLCTLRISYLPLITQATLTRVAALPCLRTLEANSLQDCNAAGERAFEPLLHSVENGALRRLDLCSNFKSVNNQLVLRFFDAITSAASRTNAASSEHLHLACGQTDVRWNLLPPELRNSRLIFVDLTCTADGRLLEDAYDSSDENGFDDWVDEDDFDECLDDCDLDSDISFGAVRASVDNQDAAGEVQEQADADWLDQVDDHDHDIDVSLGTVRASADNQDVAAGVQKQADADWLDQVDDYFDDEDDLDGDDNGEDDDWS